MKLSLAVKITALVVFSVVQVCGESTTSGGALHEGVSGGPDKVASTDIPYAPIECEPDEPTRKKFEKYDKKFKKKNPYSWFYGDGVCTYQRFFKTTAAEYQQKGSKPKEHCSDDVPMKCQLSIKDIVRVQVKKCCKGYEEHKNAPHPGCTKISNDQGEVVKTGKK